MTDLVLFFSVLPANVFRPHVPYLVALENQAVKVAFSDGKVLRGTLTGVDTYKILNKPERGPEVLISKGAIKYLQPLDDEDE